MSATLLALFWRKEETLSKWSGIRIYWRERGKRGWTIAKDALSITATESIFGGVNYAIECNSGNVLPSKAPLPLRFRFEFSGGRRVEFDGYASNAPGSSSFMISRVGKVHVSLNEAHA